MKKGYWVVAYRSIRDENALKEYAKLAVPAIQAGGGITLVRTPDPTPKEHGLKQRTVVTEFESVGAALACYESEMYQSALKALGDGAERDFRIVEGFEP